MAQPPHVQTVRIVKDTTTTSSYTGSSVTIGSGTDRAIVVRLHGFLDTASATAGATSVTHNGQSMTRARAPQKSNSRSWSEVWYLANPTTGTGTTSITCASSQRAMGANLSEYTGADQSTTIGATNSNSVSTGTSASISLTTTAADSLLLGALSIDSAPENPVVDTSGGAVSRDANDSGGVSEFNDNSFAAGDLGVASAGAASFSISWDNAEDAAWTAVELLAATSGDTNVSANTEALTLTAYSASVANDVNIASNVEALALTAYAATVSHDVEVSAAAEALALTALAATISSDTEVTAGPEALALTANVATISYDVDVSAAAEALTLTAHAATISAATEIAASVEALTLTTNQATVSLDVEVIAGPEQITLTAFPAEIAVGINVATTLEVLTLTTFPATVGFEVNVATSAESLVLTTFPAEITGGAVNRGDDAPGMFYGAGQSRRFFYEKQIRELEDVAEEIATKPIPAQKARKRLKAAIDPLATTPQPVQSVDLLQRVLAAVPAKDDGQAERDAFLAAVAAYTEAVQRQQKRRRENDALALLLMVA